MPAVIATFDTAEITVRSAARAARAQPDLGRVDAPVVTGPSSGPASARIAALWQPQAAAPARAGGPGQPIVVAAELPAVLPPVLPPVLQGVAAQPALSGRGTRLLAAVAAVGVTAALLIAVLGIAAHERADARQQVAAAQGQAVAEAVAATPAAR